MKTAPKNSAKAPKMSINSTETKPKEAEIPNEEAFPTEIKPEVQIPSEPNSEPPKSDETPSAEVSEKRKSAGRPTNASKNLPEPAYLKRGKKSKGVAISPSEAVTPSAETIAAAEKRITSSIKSTTNYDSLKLNVANRPIRRPHVNELKVLIQSRNMLHLRPIVVNKDMEIIDGQHRYTAAKELGVPIYYVKGDVSLQDMLILNTKQKSLQLADVLNYYVAQSFPEYLKLNEFISNYDLPLYNAIGLLSGRTSQPNTQLVEAFKAGDFIMKDQEHAIKVLETRDSMEEYAKDFYRQKNFTNALSRITAQPSYDDKRMMKKLKTAGYGALKQAPTTDGYVEQLLKLYNRNARKDSKLVLE